VFEVGLHCVAGFQCWDDIRHPSIVINGNNVPDVSVAISSTQVRGVWGRLERRSMSFVARGAVPAGCVHQDATFLVCQ
jgi:hypothetical protein